MGIESGPLKHKDIVVDKIKNIFKPSKKDDSAYLQSPVIDKVKGNSDYHADNAAFISKIKRG